MLVKELKKQLKGKYTDLVVAKKDGMPFQLGREFDNLNKKQFNDLLDTKVVESWELGNETYETICKWGKPYKVKSVTLCVIIK